MALLCKKCDVYIGYAGTGVAHVPTDVPLENLNDVCWICRRTRDAIIKAQENGGK